MDSRWKEFKFSQNGIDQFFGPQPPDRHTIVRAIIRGKATFFYKSHNNAVIWVFRHVEFIFALKTDLNPAVFEKNTKKKIKYLISIIFLFFVIFSKSCQQNCIKTMESWFLDGKKSNSAKMVFINFLAHSLQNRHTIVRAKIWGKASFFSKSHKNAVIRVFWHAEFISALNTELNPTVFEKNAKNKIKYYHYFLFCVIFSKRYQQNCIKTMESWFLD